MNKKMTRSLYLVFMTSCVMMVVSCSSNKPGVVAQEWSKNTSQLGIYPLYPPRERFFPGDIYIVPIASDRTINRLPAKYYMIRPLRYDHVDMSKELSNEQQVMELPLTGTMPDGKGGNSIPEPFYPYPESKKRINGVVAFPGFTFASSTEGALGINVPTGAWGIAGGAGGKANYTVSYSVPNAEMISIDLRRALQKYREYRHSLSINNIYDLYYLQEVMNARINGLRSRDSQYSDLKPGIVFVTDVYYTRRINVSITSDKGFSMQGSATVARLVELSKQAQDIENELVKIKPSVGGSGSSGGSSGSTPENQNGQSLQTQLTALQKSMYQLAQSMTPSAPGASGTVTSVSSMGVSMVQTFPYPVAIGYSAISSSVAGFIEFNPLFISEVGASVPLQTPSTQQPAGRASAQKKPSVKPVVQKATPAVTPRRDLTSQGENAHPFNGRTTIPLDVNTLTDLPE
ncbi:hypothetical protein E1B03_04205 [Citrobacter arsenatis]|uniref:Lipoprotein n=1 Tax=Citrobacter arsenatis TaxID=2546350 RepID=A0A4P6WIE7_9ENTR|nr:hypothetical protein [Citrobacter arsenatis]QBM21666.1 hypothetical protein E1B03_04205 [Citrobacter arsenatis]